MTLTGQRKNDSMRARSLKCSSPVSKTFSMCTYVNMVMVQGDILIYSLYEIYFTWMAPKAARNTISLYEGVSPRVTGLNLDQWASR